MPESKNTPGPWTLLNRQILIGPEGPWPIAEITWEFWDGYDPDVAIQREANIDLMVAAPELLEALERLVAGMDAAYDKVEQSGLYSGRPTDIDGGPISQARAAIAKARGENDGCK